MSTNTNTPITVDVIDAITSTDLVLSNNKVYKQERLYYCNEL